MKDRGSFACTIKLYDTYIQYRWNDLRQLRSPGKKRIIEIG